MRRYFWDFFGPRGEGTARHFQHHVDEFLEREGLQGCATGVDAREGAFSAWCDAPDQHRAAIERALRPMRSADL